MRLLLLTEFFPASEEGEITGGVEARCFYFARHAAARHDIRVVATSTDGRLWEHASLASLPRRLAFLARSLVIGLRADFDVVEGSNFVVHPVAWLVAALRRKPVVLWYPDVLVGSWLERFGPVGVLGELVERAILKLPVDRVIAISGTTRRKLIGAGVPETRISVVPCGFEEGLVDHIRSRRGKPEHDVVVVSRLVRYKRVDVVLRAAARLVEDHDLSVLVVGRGPELGNLRRLASELGIASRVEFLGYVASHAEVLRTIAAARIFVSASELEGFGIALVEAMALGVPYVVTGIDTFEEVTGGGRGGLLFEPGDSSDLAAKLRRLLLDDDLHARKSEEAVSFASRYTWEAVTRHTEEIFAEVLARGPDPAPRRRRH